MCLLIAQKAGAPTLDEQRIRTAWSQNSDGAGYAFILQDETNPEGALVVRKPFYKLKAFLAAYLVDHARHGATSPFMVHFRLSTHGGISADNTHPHLLTGGHVALGHNGILTNFESPFRDESDTAFFARTVLAHRHPAQLLDPAFSSSFLEPLIGANKFVLLSTYAPHLAIVNEKMGHWEDNHTWFSNNSYCQARTSYFKCWDDAQYDHKGSSLSPTSHLKGVKAVQLKEHRDFILEAAYDMAVGIKPDLDIDALSDEDWAYFVDALAEARDDLSITCPNLDYGDLEAEAILELEAAGISVPARIKNNVSRARDDTEDNEADLDDPRLMCNPDDHPRE